MTMHLDNRLSTISTKKRDVKMTKAKLADYEVRWRKHNKWAKQNNMHDMRYATIEQYIDYCHGKTPKRDVRRDRSVLQQERVPRLLIVAWHAGLWGHLSRGGRRGGVPGLRARW